MSPTRLVAVACIGLVAACGAPSEVGDTSGTSGRPTARVTTPAPTDTTTTPDGDDAVSGPSDSSAGDPTAPATAASPTGEHATTPTSPPDGSDDDEGGDEGTSRLYTAGPQPTMDTTPGQVTIAASGPTDGSSIPVLVHNGLEVAVAGVDITGDIFDDGGRTITRGHAQPLVPPVVPPGGTALARIYAGHNRLLDDAVLIDPAITYATGDDPPNSRLALPITTLETGAGQATVTISNPHDVPARPPITVMVACVGTDGDITGMLTGTIDGEELAPGATVTLTLTRSDAPTCNGVLAGAGGYASDLLGLAPTSETPGR